MVYINEMFNYIDLRDMFGESILAPLLHFLQLKS